jgi:hypothetical protein
MHALFIWTIGFQSGARARCNAEGPRPEDGRAFGHRFLRDLVHVEYLWDREPMRVRFFHRGLRPILERMLTCTEGGRESVWLLVDALYVDQQHPTWRPTQTHVDPMNEEAIVVPCVGRHPRPRPTAMPSRYTVQPSRKLPPPGRLNDTDNAPHVDTSARSFDEVIDRLAEISADNLRRYAARLPALPDLGTHIARLSCSRTEVTGRRV